MKWSLISPRVKLEGRHSWSVSCSPFSVCLLLYVFLQEPRHQHITRTSTIIWTFIRISSRVHTMNDSSSLANFPSEILLEIGNYLGGEDLLKLSQTSPLTTFYLYCLNEREPSKRKESG